MSEMIRIEGAGGKAVEDRFLVEAAGVEVWIAEGSEERGVLQALVADDELGLHGGVLVVLFYPAGDAFGEGEVIEWVAEIGDGAIDLDDFVDRAGVAGAFRADEADVERRELSVPEPRAEEEVAAAKAEAGDLVGSSECKLLHLTGEFGGGSLVGVKEKDPGVFERHSGEGRVTVGGVGVEGAGVEMGSGGLRDGRGGVGAVGVEDVDVV